MFLAPRANFLVKFGTKHKQKHSARRANTKQKHWLLQQKHHVSKNIAGSPKNMQPPTCNVDVRTLRGARACAWDNYVACVAWSRMWLLVGHTIDIMCGAATRTHAHLPHSRTRARTAVHGNVT